jgi:hypothetical protein
MSSHNEAPPPPTWWEIETLESQLEASILQAKQRAETPWPAAAITPKYPPPRIISADRDYPTAPAVETLQGASLGQLIAGCGIAAIEGYIAFKDYADANGVDLRDIKDRGIDLQDLISTLVIHTQKMAEQEQRQGQAGRWKAGGR